MSELPLAWLLNPRIQLTNSSPRDPQLNQAITRECTCAILPHVLLDYLNSPVNILRKESPYVDRENQSLVQESRKDCCVIDSALCLLQVHWRFLARTKHRAHCDLLHWIRTLSVSQGPSSSKRFHTLLGDDFPEVVSTVAGFQIDSFNRRIQKTLCSLWSENRKHNASRLLVYSCSAAKRQRIDARADFLE